MNIIPQTIISSENEMKPVFKLRLWYSTKNPAVVVDIAADVPRINMSMEYSSSNFIFNPTLRQTVESTQFPPLAECEIIINATVSGK